MPMIVREARDARKNSLSTAACAGCANEKGFPKEAS